MDVNEEVKFFGKLKKIISGGGGGQVVRGVRVDVNEEVKVL